jgi:hypothetical protein
MDIGGKAIRDVPLGGTEPTSADIEEFSRTKLAAMNWSSLAPGLYAVARNSEGFIIQMSKIELTFEEHINFDKLKPVMLIDAEQHYGIER